MAAKKKSIWDSIGNVASRVYDQVNPLDNGLTATQRTPTSNKSAVSQAISGGKNLAGSVVKPLAQFPIDAGTLAYNRLVAPTFNLPQQNIQRNPYIGGAARAVGANGSLKQTVGSGIQTGLTIGSGGLEGAASGLGERIGLTGAARVIAPRVATGVALGGGFGAGQGISEGHTAKQVLTHDIPLNAAVGGALPALGAATGAVTRRGVQTLENRTPLNESGKILVRDDVKPTPVKTAQDRAEQINTARYDISEQAKQDLAQTVKDNAGTIKTQTGAPLTIKEVVNNAKLSSKTYQTGKTREQTLEAVTKLQNSRNRVATLQQKTSDGQALTADEQAELVKHTINVKTRQADIARQLGSLRASASPKDQTLLDSVLEKLAKQGHDTDKLMEAAKNFNLNDPKQLAEFYRTFEKATKEDWLDKLRYSSMLSSPLTHIRNVSANGVGATVVAPATKLTAGALDAVHSAVTGTARTRFAGEAPAYAKGYASSFPEAAKAFSDVMTGKSLVNNPDINLSATLPLATKGAAGTADAILSFTGKLMEAADQAGMQLASGGERQALKYRSGKGVTVKNLETQAHNNAEYQLFRADLGGKDQGYLLHGIDFIPQKVFEARSSDNPLIRSVAKLVFPFVKTPTNISKQMLEYSPLGLATTIGAADKTNQIAKAVVGTIGVSLAGGALAANGRLTFSGPTNASEKARFQQEHKQPYSIKVGNNWVSYQYLHPAISFQLAAMASVKQALDSGKIDDPTAQKVLTGLAGVSKFFVDQSYFKSGQDFLNNIQGSSLNTPVSTAASFGANTVGQVIPFRALATWIDNLTDQTQRKVDYKASFLDQFGQNINKQLPGLSNSVPAATDSAGNPIAKQHPGLNAVSPAKVSTDTGGDLKDVFAASGGNATAQNAYKQGGLGGKDGQRFLQMTPAQQADAARSDPKMKKLYELKQTIDTHNKPDLILPDGIDQQSVDTLNKFNKLTTVEQQKLYASDNAAQYEHDEATYQRDKAEGKYSLSEQAAKETSLQKEAVGSSYSQDTRKLYGMSRKNLATYFAAHPDNKQVNDLVAYDQALKAAGIITTAKFKNFTPGEATTTSSGSSKKISAPSVSFGSRKAAPTSRVKAVSSSSARVKVKARSSSGNGTLKIKRGLK
jgi:hypothetical protein